MNKKNDNVVDGLRLLQLIAQKDKNRKEAEDALYLFIAYFEPKIMTWCDIHAQKVGYHIVVAGDCGISDESVHKKGSLYSN